eukprot:7382614-Prymnesium_polylepis.1
MAVRVRLSVGAVCGDRPAPQPAALTLRGTQVSILLAGIAGDTEQDVERWVERAPQAQFAKRTTVQVAQLAAAGVGSCEALGRFAFSTAFGVDAARFKLFGLLRHSVRSAQHLSGWLSTCLLYTSDAADDM